MCLWASCISQSDTQLPLSLSLTNDRAVHYKLPCDSVWITLDWKIWTAWRYKGRTPLYLGQRFVRVTMWDLSHGGNQSSGGADSGTMHLWSHLSTTCGSHVLCPWPPYCPHLVYSLQNQIRKHLTTFHSSLWSLAGTSYYRLQLGLLW